MIELGRQSHIEKEMILLQAQDMDVAIYQDFTPLFRFKDFNYNVLLRSIQNFTGEGIVRKEYQDKERMEVMIKDMKKPMCLQVPKELQLKNYPIHIPSLQGATW